MFFLLHFGRWYANLRYQNRNIDPQIIFELENDEKNKKSKIEKILDVAILMKFTHIKTIFEPPFHENVKIEKLFVILRIFGTAF